MLTDPLGPLAIRWSYLPQIAPWLFHFVRASSPARVEAASIALRALLKGAMAAYDPLLDRKGVVSGKSVSVRVDLGGRRIIKKKTIRSQQTVNLPPKKRTVTNN